MPTCCASESTAAWGSNPDGNYKFLTTEHLYTIGVPTGLAADLISFLRSGPVTAQLRATSSFIACGDLAGSALARTDGC